MELISHYRHLEHARNAAIAWLEAQGVQFGPYRNIVIGRIGAMKGAEAGVSASDKPFWRLRLDFDPVKGPHFNAEFGEGAARRKAAFVFLGSEALVVRLAAKRAPR